MIDMGRCGRRRGMNCVSQLAGIRLASIARSGLNSQGAQDLGCKTTGSFSATGAGDKRLFSYFSPALSRSDESTRSPDGARSTLTNGAPQKRVSGGFSGPLFQADHQLALMDVDIDVPPGVGHVGSEIDVGIILP